MQFTGTPRSRGGLILYTLDGNVEMRYISVVTMQRCLLYAARGLLPPPPTGAMPKKGGTRKTPGSCWRRRKLQKALISQRAHCLPLRKEKSGLHWERRKKEIVCCSAGVAFVHAHEAALMSIFASCGGDQAGLKNRQTRPNSHVRTASQCRLSCSGGRKPAGRARALGRRCSVLTTHRAELRLFADVRY